MVHEKWNPRLKVKNFWTLEWTNFFKSEIWSPIVSLLEYIGIYKDTNRKKKTKYTIFSVYERIGCSLPGDKKPLTCIQIQTTYPHPHPHPLYTLFV